MNDKTEDPTMNTSVSPNTHHTADVLETIRLHGGKYLVVVGGMAAIGASIAEGPGVICGVIAGAVISFCIKD
jgi:hypothetical protein